MDAPDLLRELRLARGELLNVCRGVSEGRLRVRPADQEWSAIEVLAHLIDVDRHWLAQAIAICDDPAHEFVPFDDARWKLEHPAVRDAPLAPIMLALTRAHAAVVQSLQQLSPGELARTGRHPRRPSYSVADVFSRYPAHDRDHARQLEEILRRGPCLSDGAGR